MRTKRNRCYWPIAGLLLFSAALAATPPPLVNYQGVLRNQNDAPLSGPFDMVLRFLDAESGGNEILVDQHAAATANAVIVSDGLFNVALGSGTVTDGSGPGTYTTLDAVFRDYGDVWLQVQVGAETLSPRTRIHSAPFALNATRLDGRSAGSFIDTSSTAQTKTGRLTVSGGGSGFDSALKAENLASGGIGLYANAQGIAVLGFGGTGGSFQGSDLGVRASGTFAGGYFDGNTYGVFARSPNGSAGRFESSNSYAPSADLAYGNIGVTGNCAAFGCSGVAGYGDTQGVVGTANGVYTTGAVGGVFVGNGALGKGVSATGVTGGLFRSTGTPGLLVKLADSGTGVDVSGAVSEGIRVSAIGWGVNSTSGDQGVRAEGGNYGGYFTATNFGSTGVAGVGYTHGGFFENAGVEYARVASQGVSISGVGPTNGSYFANGSPWFSYAYMPSGHEGIHALGSTVGGEFNNFATSSYAYVGYSTYKIFGIGSMNFVQNHPDDPSKVIVYAAPEGDEVAVYTRGSGKLVDGEARVKLGETFALVANPDIGLTATVTPLGEVIPLAIVAKSTGELIVRGPAGSNAAFDYTVWGLRIGFEEQSIVQPKQRESKIPSMHEHESFFREDAALRGSTALARFADMEERVHGTSQLNLERAHRLRDAIGVFPQGNPLDDRKEGPGRLEPPLLSDGGMPSAPPVVATAAPRPAGALPVAVPAGRPARPPRDDRDLFDVVGVVSVGDVVSLVAGSPGAVALSAGPDDALVIGCAQASEAAGPGGIAVATSRIALCRVDASFGAVAVGDALVASPVPGTAMGAAAGAAAKAVLGRAIDPLESGADVIRVLLGVR
jgi:hypothetical protein